MELMKDYNQFAQTSNPIYIKSSFLNQLPSEKIEVRSGLDDEDNQGTTVGRYDLDSGKKFVDSIEKEGIKDYIILRIEKCNGINDIKIEDGNHRVYAMRKTCSSEIMVPVIFKIQRDIPAEQLTEMFYMMYQAKLIDHKDFSSIVDQMVIAQLESIEKPVGAQILSEETAKPAYEYFKGSALFSFFDDIFTGKYKAYRHTEGINVAGTLKNGRIGFKFADNKEIYNVEKEYPLAKAGSDNDVIRAAAQAIQQSIHNISPEMLRTLGFFKGNGIEGKLIYSEIEDIVPFTVGVNYIEMKRVVNSNGENVNLNDALERLERNLGTITVTSDIVQYEGESLSQIRYYVSSKSSTGKFIYRQKIKHEDLLEPLEDVVNYWKTSEEGHKLLSGDLTKEEAYDLAKELSKKIGNSLVQTLSQQQSTSDIVAKVGKGGIDFEDIDGGIVSIHAGYEQVIQKQANIVNSAKRIDRELSKAIANDILGMRINVIGLDYSTRFNSDPEKYLMTKSNKFDHYNHTPKAIFNKSNVINLIDSAILRLQKLYDESLTLGGIQEEKSLNYIKSVAYNINRFRKLVIKSKTYADLTKSFASYHHVISESVIKQKIMEK